jgi:hypothetical protein
MKQRSRESEPVHKWKVVQISYVWTPRKSDALTFVQEGTVRPEVECAVEEKPKGWMGTVLKQLTG